MLPRYLGAFTDPFSKEYCSRIYINMNTNKNTWLGNRTWNTAKYNITKGPINNPLNSHPNALKAWFYNIFWGGGKNDLYKMISYFNGKVPNS